MTEELVIGDVVDVSLCDGDYTYRGVVTSATQRHVYVNTRSSGHPHRRGTPGLAIKLVERTGKRTFRDAFAHSQQFP